MEVYLSRTLVRIMLIHLRQTHSRLGNKGEEREKGIVEAQRRFCIQESCMVWELGMEELNALLFTHPKLKAQMVEGFHKALQHRMQSNPRTRWYGIVLAAD